MAGAPAAAVGTLEWTASLTPRSGTGTHGTATLAAGSRGGETQAAVELTGATAGAVHPWHVHRGRCGEDRGIVGPAGAYPALSVAGDGTARLSVVLPFAVPTDGEYYVNVHHSPDDIGTIVACGNLVLGR